MPSISPGMTYLPPASIVVAPAGTGVEAAGPAAVIRPSVNTTTPPVTGAAPVPSITVPPVMATVWAAAPGAIATVRSSASVALRAELARGSGLARWMDMADSFGPSVILQSALGTMRAPWAI